MERVKGIESSCQCQMLDFGLMRALTMTDQATRAKLRMGMSRIGWRSCALATVTPYADATHASMRRFKMAKITKPKRASPVRLVKVSQSKTSG